MESKNLKGKITINQLDLSSFLVCSLVHGFQVSQAIPLTINLNEDPQRPQVANVVLALDTPGASPIMGEFAICDFVSATKNCFGGKATRLGQNLNYDHYLHVLNTGLRVLATEFVINKNQDTQGEIKA